MPATGFKSVALPDPVVDRIDKRLKKDRTYRSRGELVKAAVLDFLDEKAHG